MDGEPVEQLLEIKKDYLELLKSDRGHLMFLISEQCDIELQMEYLILHRLYLIQAISCFIDTLGKYECGSDSYKFLEIRIKQLEELFNPLDDRINQLKIREEEIKSVRDELSKSLQEKT